MIKKILRKIVKKIKGNDAQNIFEGKKVVLKNYIGGEWSDSTAYESVADPMTGLEMY